MARKPATDSEEEGAGHHVGESSGTNKNVRTNKSDRNNKSDRSDSEESQNEGCAARSTNSVEASDSKITTAGTPQNYDIANLIISFSSVECNFVEVDYFTTFSSVLMLLRRAEIKCRHYLL